MSTVFISYCRRDHFFAELARLKLVEAGIHVWVDKTNLRAGDDWRKAIDKGISDSFATIVALSPESVKSAYVTYEWASAIGKTKPVVPVLLDECERHPRLEPIQYLDFSNTGYQPWQQLIEWIRDIRDNAEVADSEDGSAIEAADSPVEAEVASDEGRAAELILAYLNRRGLQMVSFERIRTAIDTSYSEAFLRGMIATHRDIFRPAMLKGERPGVGRV